MRIAAISDIHSNVYALNAVLADIKTRGVDVTVNLGDILYGPIAPKDTYDCLMASDSIAIRGNQDRQIYEATVDDAHSNPTLAFILDDLGQEPLQWMRHLPFDRQLDDDVYLCHGTPTDDRVYLLESVAHGQPELRADEDIVALLNGQQSSLILCGHTHVPRMVTTSTNQTIVNPGSVGLPAYTDDQPVYHAMQNFSHHASYCLVQGASGKWAVEHIKVEYDFEKAVSDAEQRHRKDWSYSLRTGRAV